jgi:hypothetical protein
MLRKLAVLAAFAVLGGAAVAVAAPGDNADNNIAGARQASARFARLADAQAAGYGLLTDAAGIQCIDLPGTGAMGVHFVKGAHVGDTVLDPKKPEALVYEPQAGHLHLVALEYVVFQAAWDAEHASPPSLFGQEFMLTPAPNRFGLPAFYSLHAWLYKHNPAGMFAMWNPNVHCPAASGATASGDMAGMPGMG